MVGKINFNAKVKMNLCCQKVHTIFTDKKTTISSLKTASKFTQKMIFPLMVLSAVLLILFVLWITSRDLSKETVHKYERTINLHSEKSTFHYGVVIDCGSSGSRVYIYYWPPHSGNPTELLKLQQMMDHGNDPVRMKIKPGIASYADKPQNATDYLRPLLEFAGQHVPKSKHKETPLFILATAGMRLLKKNKQNALLENLRTEIPKKYNFHLSPSQVEVLSGKQEGIYLWIAINYILGRFDHSHGVSTTQPSVVAPAQRKPTVGCVEMGGASMQIAYEVPNNVSLRPDLSVDINLGCDTHMTVHRYKIYVSTFLGVGTIVARKRYIEALLKKNSHSFSQGQTITDPCLPRDLTDEGHHKSRYYRLSGNGKFKECQAEIIKLLNTTAPCKTKPCSLDGIHQPPINFDQSEFYGFAEFWYSTQDILRLGGQYEDDRMDQMAVDFCQRTWAVNQKYYNLGLYPKADGNRLRSQCFKSAWMTTVLHYGLKFPRGYKGLTSALIVNGKEIQWTLGAMLYRTRFMPLREIQQQQLSSAKSFDTTTMWLTFDHKTFSAILLMCSLIVVAAVLVYCRRLRLYRKSNVFHHGEIYHSVPSQNYPQDMRVKV